HVSGPAREVAQLYVGCAGDMAGVELVELPDIQHRCAADLVVAYQGWGGGGTIPRRHAAGELAGGLVEPDLEGLPGDLGKVLVGIADDDERCAGFQQPAEPGYKLRSQGDRDSAAGGDD